MCMYKCTVCVERHSNRAFVCFVLCFWITVSLGGSRKLRGNVLKKKINAKIISDKNLISPGLHKFNQGELKGLGYCNVL